MARIKKNNKDVFQSYILTVAKYDFSTYEKRILYRLVEMAQKDVPQPLRDNMRKVEPSNCGVNITMPVADILKDETQKLHKSDSSFQGTSRENYRILGQGNVAMHIHHRAPRNRKGLRHS